MLDLKNNFVQIYELYLIHFRCFYILFYIKIKIQFYYLKAFKIDNQIIKNVYLLLEIVQSIVDLYFYSKNENKLKILVEVVQFDGLFVEQIYRQQLK